MPWNPRVAVAYPATISPPPASVIPPHAGNRRATIPPGLFAPPATTGIIPGVARGSPAFPVASPDGRF